MKKFLPALALAILFVPGSPQPADAGEVRITMSHGRVTLIAHDVTVRQILEEWARVGQTRIVNADKIMGPPVTLEMHDEPEGKVLDAVLRSAAGYVVAPRADGAGASMYDRIMILATSRAPAVTAPPPTFNRPPLPQPVIPTVEDDQPQVVDDQGVPQPGMVPPPGAQPFPGPAQTPGIPQPTTTPRPGMPPPPVVPGNPYQTPGARPPGGVGVPGATPGPPGTPGAPGTPGGPPVGPGGGPGGPGGQ